MKTFSNALIVSYLVLWLLLVILFHKLFLLAADPDWCICSLHQLCWHIAHFLVDKFRQLHTLKLWLILTLPLHFDKRTRQVQNMGANIATWFIDLESYIDGVMTWTYAPFSSNTSLHSKHHLGEDMYHQYMLKKIWSQQRRINK